MGARKKEARPLRRAPNGDEGLARALLASAGVGDVIQYDAEGNRVLPPRSDASAFARASKKPR